MTNASMLFVGSVVSLLLSSCAMDRPAHYWYAANQVSVAQIEKVLQDNPVAPDENIHVTTLGASDLVSHHIVQVRHSESLHIHKDHDLTVFIYKGHGEMRVGTHRFRVNRGDVLYIPRAVPHAFTNQGEAPATAIVVFNPAFDGKDTVPFSE